MATDINLTPTAGMPPVETVTTPNLVSPGVSFVEPSPAQAAADRGVINEAQGVAQAADAVGPAIQQQREGQAAGMDELAAEKQREAKERDAYAAARQPKVDAAMAEMKAAEEKYQNHKFYDYFSSLPTGDRIIARLGMFLGGVAAGPGGNNSALENVRRDIDRDFEKQKIQLHSKDQVAKWKREGFTDLYDQLQKGLAELTVKQAMAYDAVKAKVDAMALRAGTPEAVAKQEVIAREYGEKAAEKRQEAVRHMERRKDVPALVGTTQTTTAGRGAAPTEAQSKDALLGQGLADDVAIIKSGPPLTEKELASTQASELSTQGADETAAKGGVSGMLVGAGVSAARGAGLMKKTVYEGLSPEKQKVLNAWHDAQEKIARKYTGAGMRPDEARGEALRDAPRPGDSPELVAQKLKRVEDTANRLIQLAGRAGAAVAAPSEAAPHAPPRGTVQRNKKTGAVRIADGKGGWKEQPRGR